MCYSTESSLRTTLLSAACIFYLLSSGDPHFMWVAVTLVGWCSMQFAEFILWSTNPRNGCSDLNRIVTLTLIPFVLVLQLLGSLFGSLLVIPWQKSSDGRKLFFVGYCLSIILIVCIQTYYKPYKLCTTITKGGHLNWNTSNHNTDNNFYKFCFFLWGFLILFPFILYWNKKSTFILMISLFPLFGFSYGILNSDSRASIWCYYTSYTSIIAAGLLFLKQTGVYNVL